MAEKGDGSELALLKNIDLRELQDEGKSVIARLADDLAKVIPTYFILMK
jgi:hypothetical protein